MSSKQLVVQFNDEPHIRLTEMARLKRVTPQHLVAYLRDGKGFVSACRRIDGMLKFEYLDEPLTWHLMRSVYVRADLGDNVPIASDDAVDIAVKEYALAVAEERAALDEYRNAPRWKTTESEEYRAHLRASFRLGDASDELYDKGRRTLFVAGAMLDKKSDALVALCRYIAAQKALVDAREACEQAAFDESYYGSEFPESKSRFHDAYNRTLSAEETARNEFIAARKNFILVCKRCPDRQLRALARYLKSVQSLLDAERAADEVDWNDEDASDAAYENARTARLVEQDDHRRFVRHLDTIMDASDRARAEERLARSHKRADSTFDSRNKH